MLNGVSCRLTFRVGEGYQFSRVAPDRQQNNAASRQKMYPFFQGVREWDQCPERALRLMRFALP